MTAVDYVNIASKALVIGAVLQCIVIMIGYVFYFVFRILKKGGV